MSESSETDQNFTQSMSSKNIIAIILTHRAFTKYMSHKNQFAYDHVFVEHVTSKAAMCLDSDVCGYFLVRTISMTLSCGTRLTAVAVGLSIVALDDEEMKTPASTGCSSHSKDCYCRELPESIFVLE